MLTFLLISFSIMLVVPLGLIGTTAWLLKRTIKKHQQKDAKELAITDTFNWRRAMTAIHQPTAFVPFLNAQQPEIIRYFLSFLPLEKRAKIIQQLAPSVKITLMKQSHFSLLTKQTRDEKTEQLFCEQLQQTISHITDPFQQLELYRFLLPPKLNEPLATFQQTLRVTDAAIAQEALPVMLTAVATFLTFDASTSYEAKHNIQTFIERDILEMLFMYNQLEHEAKGEKKHAILQLLATIHEELQQTKTQTAHKNEFQLDKKMTSLLKKYNKK